MRYYAAPMEGITGYIFRTVHHACFPGVTAYYTPFLAPNQNHVFTARERNDILPAHNINLPLIPQILTNNAEDFIWAANALNEMGYDEINLNLGCPSPTVVAKGKGAGMLADPDKLDRFLDVIFSRLSIKLSIKTRIGIKSDAEFPALLKVFSQYPLHELIIHPRVQKDMYKNHPQKEAFVLAENTLSTPLCYNGDLCSPEDCLFFIATHPDIHALMLGRGLIANPNLISSISVGNALDKGHLKAFHDQLFNSYEAVLPGAIPLIYLSLIHI